MSWQPQDEPLRQLAQCLKDSISGNHRLMQSAEVLLKHAKSSPDFDKYLIYVFGTSQPPSSVTLDPASYYQARAAAVIMLKNDIRTSYKTLDESTKTYVQSMVINSLQDPSAQMRGYAGNVITELIRQGGLLSWPQVLDNLISLVSNTNGNVSAQAQEGAMGALFKICEDNRKALDKDFQGQRPLDLLYPMLLQITSSPLPKVRADALNSINIFITHKLPIVMSHMDELMQNLFRLAHDESEEVRKHVCRAFVYIAEVAPEQVVPHMQGLVEFMLTQQRNKDNDDLALDASEFWLAIGEDEKIRDHLGPFLDKIVPVLLESMVWGEDDILRLEGEKEDAEQEDREEDIRPTFATSKQARVTANGANSTQAVNGTESSGQSGYDDDDDLSEGEIEDSDDESIGDPEDQWNLRKCSAAALDVLASTFHEHVFTHTLPYLKNNLNHSEWPYREAAVLALGAIADGCMSVMEPHLPDLTPFLINLLNDSEPVVRQITCWALGRYSQWASHLDPEGKRQYFLPMMDGILKRMLDSNKRVQEAAASAFANLEEKASVELTEYCPVIVNQFVQCFAKYKDRNMFILYDCVQTLAEHVGPALAREDLVNTLMPALIQRWNKVSDQSREMFPLLECLAYVATALGHRFSPYADGIFQRCILIIHGNLEDSVRAAENPAFDVPDKDFLVTSLDLLSAMIQALEQPVSARLLSDQQGFFNMLAVCMRDENNDVRQSAYALLGDCAIYVFDQLRPHLQMILEIAARQLDMSQIQQDGEETGYAVINNTCWSIGEIALREQAGMRPFVDTLLPKLAEILFNGDAPYSLNENAALAIGRLGMGCPQELGVHLTHLAPPFLQAMRKIAWTDEKSHALIGFMNMALANPAAMEQTLLSLFEEMAKADPNAVAGPGQAKVLRQTFQKVIELYKTMIPDFDGFLNNLPPPDVARFRDLYMG
ncbi:ARM repeat-containing protein [Sporormia fimetaria CBS 119925]|uniref:ARM repeat-containing protein n=1 Tax=Sporormia fimetaria CBS 119925 TaxID=1340428 RepID=A0A6A6VG08_9PLEO|nr:ARM repeat-containing protein [Sporormia fimetaria CBS 119925]